MTRHLPVLDPRPASPLDQLAIESPCPADWERMRGDHRARFCGECRQHVYDLSAMTRAEAEGLIRKHHGSLCVRLRRRPDGRVVTADCRERLRAARRRGLLPLVVALVLVGITQLGLRLFGVHLAWDAYLDATQDPEERTLMGDIAPPFPRVEPVAAPVEPVATPVEPVEPVAAPVKQIPRPAPPAIMGRIQVRDLP